MVAYEGGGSRDEAGNSWLLKSVGVASWHWIHKGSQLLAAARFKQCAKVWNPM